MSYTYKQTKRQTEITTLYRVLYGNPALSGEFFSLKSPNTQIRTFRKKTFPWFY